MNTYRGSKKVPRRLHIQKETKPSALGFLVVFVLAILPAFFQGQQAEKKTDRSPACVSKAPVETLLFSEETRSSRPPVVTETNETIAFYN